MQLCLAYCERHDWEAALQTGKEYIERFPDQEFGYCAAATALDELGRFDEAIALTQKNLQLHPGFLPAIEGLAWTYAKLNQLPDVIRELKRALELNPNSAELHGWLAHTYIESGDIPAAVEQQAAITKMNSALADEVADMIAKAGKSGTAS
jgi:tetratricopeptide (TPR) repeat protein